MDISGDSVVEFRILITLLQWIETRLIQEGVNDGCAFFNNCVIHLQLCNVNIMMRTKNLWLYYASEKFPLLAEPLLGESSVLCYTLIRNGTIL
jgi:hypothetical protein